MPTLINNPVLEEALIAERRDLGIDKFDEVWDGVYVMAPIANNEHQDIQSELVMILGALIKRPKLGRVHAGANVSDQLDDWRQNFRVPDVLVFLNSNPAEDRDTHWFGGPDFAVEIASRWDRSREKIAFYSSIGVRELLIIDRDPKPLTPAPCNTRPGGIKFPISNVTDAGGSGTISSVSFYRESNGTTGLQTTGDTLVGTGTLSGST